MKTILALGLSAAAALVLPADLQAQCATSGSTLTTYAGGNGQQGAMFDIDPTVPMTIECLDIQWNNTTDLLDFEIWYTTGTSFGNETNPAVWTLLGSVSQVPADPGGLPTQLDISGNGVLFQPGQTYGIYVYNVNYPSIAGFLVYSNGAAPTLYTGTHCDITTNAGVFGFFGGIFQTREFNGELRTEAAASVPTLQISQGLPGGLMDFQMFGFTASGQAALVYGPASVFVVPGGPCAALSLDLQPINASNPILVPMDGFGSALYTQYVPPQGSGISLQAVDVATCVASGAIVLP